MTGRGTSVYADGGVAAVWRAGHVDISVRLGAMDPDEFNSMRYLPIVDVSRLRDEWGFEPECSTAAALADFRTALDRVIAVGRGTVARRARRARRA